MSSTWAGICAGSCVLHWVTLGYIRSIGPFRSQVELCVAGVGSAVRTNTCLKYKIIYCLSTHRRFKCFVYAFTNDVM